MQKIWEPKYPYKTEGVFLVKGKEIVGVYESLPCGGYAITDKLTSMVVASGTHGSESEVELIKETKECCSHV